MAERLLEVKDLKVQFATEDGIVNAVDGVSFTLDRGQVLGIVGESGSGKSVTSMTMLGLTRGVNARFEGEVNYKGRDLLGMSEDELQTVRGNEIAMIFQDPMTAHEPGVPGRRPDRRGTSGAQPGDEQAPGAGSGRRAPARRRDPEPGVARATIIRTSSRAACASAR